MCVDEGNLQDMDDVKIMMEICPITISTGVWINREQGKCVSPCPRRSYLRIRSRETGSAVPSRVSLIIFHTPTESDTCTHGIPLAFRDGVHLFIVP